MVGSQNKMSRNRKQEIAALGIVFAAIITLYIIIQAFSGMYPFGDKSNLFWDMDIQYVDYFAFFREVLLGNAGLSYSFSKSLGGSLIALFGYYLGCPLNLLVVFFQADQLPVFIYILTAIKLGLAGVTARILLTRRFPEISGWMTVMMGISYGLMQYNLVQMSNVMWLDGVILLPLLLLAVYRFVSEGKKAGLFVMVLISIAMNWYTGYMTGIFAVCYFLYERILICGKWDKNEWKKFFIDGVRCGFIMLAGVLGSCFIFYPVAQGLQKGKQVFSLDIFYPHVYGSFADIFRGFALGSVVSTAALYCGLLFFVFFIYYFLSGQIERREKILSLTAVLFMFVSCWFAPLDCIWSGMRIVGSYPFRFAFVVIFLVLYLAARGVKAYEEQRDHGKMACICGGCILLFLFLNWRQEYQLKLLATTILILAVYFLSFLAAKHQKILKVLIPGVLAVELVLNGVFTFQNYYAVNSGISEYSSYVKGSKEQVTQIKKYDDSVFYRMDTFQKRAEEGVGCSAYLNEAMVQGYSGLNHYSSTFDTNISDMLWRTGYSTQQTMSIVSESILPADSLFGMKYVLTKNNVQGYEKIEEISQENGKSVYYNPYALGLGMKVADSVYEEITTEDPFEYQNQLYSNILGRDVELFKRIEPAVSLENNVLTFSIPAMGKSDLLYGYVDSEPQDLTLHIDGTYRCDYACWLSYKVFGIGDGSKEHSVVLDHYSGTLEDMTPYFYYLDQDVFEKAIEELKAGEMNTEVFEDGHVSGTCNAESDTNLLLSIPYDEGWTAVVNGKEVEVKEGADALTVIPLKEGENRIELKYHVPGVKVGMGLSVLGVLMFLGICGFERRRLL